MEEPLLDSAAPVSSTDSLQAYGKPSLEQTDQTWLSLQPLSISGVAREINTFATAVGVSGFPLRGNSL